MTKIIKIPPKLLKSPRYPKTSKITQNTPKPQKWPKEPQKFINTKNTHKTSKIPKILTKPQKYQIYPSKPLNNQNNPPKPLKWAKNHKTTKNIPETS